VNDPAHAGVLGHHCPGRTGAAGANKPILLLPNANTT
jgi:hypothetical protein